MTECFGIEKSTKSNSDALSDLITIAMAQPTQVAM